MSREKVIRQRTTWGRNAAEAPALPGRDLETKVWPAAEGDHDESLYENGSFESWAELPVPGPYPKGEPPADPGTEEEGMHPAAKRAAAARRGEEQARKIRERSARCVRAAELYLGKRATEAEIERLAERMMDDPKRLAQAEALVGGPTACPDGMMVDEVPVDIDDPVLDAPVVDEFADMPNGAYDDIEIVAMRDKMASLEKSFDVVSRRLAMLTDQIGVTKAASTKARSVMAAHVEATLKAAGAKGGKLRLADFKGPRSVFALLDRDKDGLITASDLLASLGFGAARRAEDDKEDEGSKEAGRKAELPPEFLEQQQKMKDKSDDKDDDKGDDKGDDDKKAALHLALEAATSAARAAVKAAFAQRKAEDDPPNPPPADDDAVIPEDKEEEAAKEASTKSKAASPAKAAPKAAAPKAAAAPAKPKAAAKVAEEEVVEDEDEEVAVKEAAAKLAAAKKAAAAKRAAKLAAAKKADEEEQQEEVDIDVEDEGSDKSAGDDPVVDVNEAEGEGGGEEDEMDKSAFDADNDPMGMAGADDFNITAEEEQALQMLYPAGDAGIGQPKAASNLNLRPQPKKPSQGIKSARVASGQARRASSDAIPSDLANVWTSPPNVSGHFKTGA